MLSHPCTVLVNYLYQLKTALQLIATCQRTSVVFFCYFHHPLNEYTQFHFKHWRDCTLKTHPLHNMYRLQIEVLLEEFQGAACALLLLGYFTRVNFGVSFIFPTGTKASFLITVLVLLLYKAILLYAVIFFKAKGIEMFPMEEKYLFLAGTPAKILSYIPLGMTGKLLLPLLLSFFTFLARWGLPKCQLTLRGISSDVDAERCFDVFTCCV